MSTVEESYASKLFANGLYTIWATEPDSTDAVNTNEDKGPYPVGTTYEIKFTEESALKIPLALLYATFQIALSDVANYQAESYMNKIITNQNIQVAANSAIKDVEQMKTEIPADVAEYMEENPSLSSLDALKSTNIAVPKEGPIKNTNRIPHIVADVCTDKDIVGVSILHIECGKGTSVGKPVITSPVAGDTYTSTSKMSYEYTVKTQCLKTDGSLAEYDVTFTATEETVTTYKWRTVDGKEQWVQSGTPKSTVDTDNETLSAPHSSISIYDPTLSADFVEKCHTAGVTKLDDGTSIEEGAQLTDAQLENLLEELNIALEDSSASTQEDMLYAEEYLGQYNSYLAGGSTNIDDLANALQAIAQRI